MIIISPETWSKKDMQGLNSGIEAVELAFSRINPLITFDSIFYDFTFNLSPSIAYYGYTDKYENKITFRPRKVFREVFIHEVGHGFAKVTHPGPMEVLDKESIYTPSGKFITGIHPIYRRIYWRHGKKKSPFNGYKSDGGIYQLHPLTMKDSNNASEDWADMFLNWVLSSFADNEVGNTLYTWVDNHMKLWLI